MPGAVTGADGPGTATALYGSPPQAATVGAVSSPHSPVAGSTAAVAQVGRPSVLGSPVFWLVALLGLALGLIQFSVSFGR